MRRRQRQVRHVGLDEDSSSARPVQQVVACWPAAGRAESEAGGGVGLRIEVDQQHRRARLGDARGHVDRGRGLADAALLIGKRVDARDVMRSDGSDRERTLPGHAGPPREPLRRRLRACRPPPASGHRPATGLHAPRRRPMPPPRRSSAAAVGVARSRRSAARPAAPAAGTARAATGGGASARATARSNRSRPFAAGDLLRPSQDHLATRRHRRAQLAQKRRLARDRLEQGDRGADQSASGMPGEPLPVPTSTTRPARRAHHRRAASESPPLAAGSPRDRAAGHRHVGRGQQLAVGVAVGLRRFTCYTSSCRRASTTWRSGSSSLAGRGQAAQLLHLGVHDLAFHRRHRLERYGSPVRRTSPAARTATSVSVRSRRLR